MTHRQICAKGGRAKSPEKAKAGAKNLKKARAVVAAKWKLFKDLEVFKELEA